MAVRSTSEPPYRTMRITAGLRRLSRRNRRPRGQVQPDRPAVIGWLSLSARATSARFDSRAERESSTMLTWWT
jgi:hypothetical protein